MLNTDLNALFLEVFIFIKINLVIVVIASLNTIISEVIERDINDGTIQQSMELELCLSSTLNHNSIVAANTKVLIILGNN